MLVVDNSMPSSSLVFLLLLIHVGHKTGALEVMRTTIHGWILNPFNHSINPL